MIYACMNMHGIGAQPRIEHPNAYDGGVEGDATGSTYPRAPQRNILTLPRRKCRHGSSAGPAGGLSPLGRIMSLAAPRSPSREGLTTATNADTRFRESPWIFFPFAVLSFSGIFVDPDVRACVPLYMRGRVTGGRRIIGRHTGGQMRYNWSSLWLAVLLAPVPGASGKSSHRLTSMTVFSTEPNAIHVSGSQSV
jgi:hypothetical protein